MNCEERGGLSDGNLIWDAVPTLDGLGPWGDNDHCSERSPDGAKLPEFVDASSFVPKAMLNIIAIQKLSRLQAMNRISALLIVSAGLTAGLSALAAPASLADLTNRTDRLEWFRDQGFGLFVHWNLDSQLGSVISHSMVGASEDYLKRYVEELPKSFNPRKFHPQDWAALAKLAGVRYVVFTAKHHSGFCMWPTATTDFNIRRTPFKRDITGEILRAFKEQGIAPGLYFSPDDFWWLYTNHKTLQRNIPDVQPANNPGLMAHDLAQVRELLTRYGPVDGDLLRRPGPGLA